MKTRRFTVAPRQSPQDILQLLSKSKLKQPIGFVENDRLGRVSEIGCVDIVVITSTEEREKCFTSSKRCNNRPGVARIMSGFVESCSNWDSRESPPCQAKKKTADIKNDAKMDHSGDIAFVAWVLRDLTTS